jgi:hypothetical protein
MHPLKSNALAQARAAACFQNVVILLNKPLTEKAQTDQFDVLNAHIVNVIAISPENDSSTVLPAAIR